MNISVIIPVYNAEKFIAKALDSCLQIPEIKEIIVIDDGYKDNSRNIVDSYAQAHPFVKVYQHPNNENRGAAASRNLGLKMATQEFIAFLDADDFYLPNRFTKDKEIFIKNPDADGCYNALGVYFYSQRAKEQFQEHFLGKEITTVSKKKNPTPTNLLQGLSGVIKGFGHFSLDCLTVKKEAIKRYNLAFNNRLLLHQDSEFILKLAHYCTIYPSEIKIPVAKRGVHEENRITANFSDLRINKYLNRFLQYDSLLRWGQKENIDREVLNRFNQEFDFYRLAKTKTPSLSILIREVIRNPSLLKNERFNNLLDIYTQNLGRVGRFMLYQVPRTLYRTINQTE